MPEMLFRLRWPDASETLCYSPSRAIGEFLRAGAEYPLSEFLDRSRAGLTAASERVRARHGMACSRAMAQLATIERDAVKFADQTGALVVVASLDRA